MTEKDVLMHKNSLMLDTPMPITTSRLVIRPLMPGDGKKINEAIVESFDQFNKWLPWARIVPTVDDSEETARLFYADFILRKAFHLIILHEDRLVGMCGFHAVEWDIPSAEIGYWCRVTEQGKGYITEAVSALTVYGFKQLRFSRIAILCEEENSASQKVAERTGFVLESKSRGILPNLRGEGLVASRCYVRFDEVGLDKDAICW